MPEGLEIEHMLYRVEGGALVMTTHGHDVLSEPAHWFLGRADFAQARLPRGQHSVSRIAMVVTLLDTGHVVVRGTQLEPGYLEVTRDAGIERYRVARGTGWLELSPGNYTAKLFALELVAKVHLAVPRPAAMSGNAGAFPSVAHHTGTITGWVPLSSAETAWIDVAALAVTLDRYPEERTRTSPIEALREACKTVLNHGSPDWVNARLGEALAAHEINMVANAPRLVRVVHYYGDGFFTDDQIRKVRSNLGLIRGALADETSDALEGGIGETTQIIEP